MRAHPILSAARLLPLLLVAPPALAQRTDPLPGLDTYIEKARQDWGVVGLGVAVVKNDSVIYAKGFGLREVGKPDKVDERTLFAIGSNSKSFTALALGILQDEGKLDLDDRATKHLPGFVVSDPYVTRELTLRDLITHRSGYFRGDALWNGSGFSRDEVLRRAAHQPVSTSFRSTFGYNNIMFLAAGEVIGKVSGRTWDGFVKNRILTPLGMTTSNTSVRELTGPNVATPHALVNDRPVAIKYRNIDNIGPAGSINSSVLEMAQYIRFHLRGGEYRGQRLVSKKFHQEMLTPQMISGTGRDTLFPMVHFDTYGLALWLRDYYGKKLVSHGGGIDGMLSQMAWIPEADVGVVVLTNTDGQNLMNALAYKVLDQMIGAPSRDWSAIMLAQSRIQRQRTDSIRATLAAARVSGTRPSLAVDRYVGRYEHPMWGEIQITEEGQGLVLRRSAESWATLEHWHYDTYRVDWNSSRAPGNLTFAMFRVDPRARVTAVEVRGTPFASPYSEGAVFTRKAEARTAGGMGLGLGTRNRE